MAFIALPSAFRKTSVANPQWGPRCSATNDSNAPITTSANLFTRRTLLAAVASASGSLLAASLSNAADAPPSNLNYSVVTKGDGPKAEFGDLVGIRFKGAYNGVVFDNLFEDKKPYFYRAGSGVILKGLDDAVLLMSVGDVYDLDIPGDLAFGSKGRRASAGKPSIPPNATVNYTLELTTIPGKDPELLEVIADE